MCLFVCVCVCAVDHLILGNCAMTNMKTDKFQHIVIIKSGQYLFIYLLPILIDSHSLCSFTVIVFFTDASCPTIHTPCDKLLFNRCVSGSFNVLIDFIFKIKICS